MSQFIDKDYMKIEGGLGGQGVLLFLFTQHAFSAFRWVWNLIKRSHVPCPGLVKLPRTLHLLFPSSHPFLSVFLFCFSTKK